MPRSQEGADVRAYMMAAKLRKLTTSNKPKAFSISPESGDIGPFTTKQVTITFHPTDSPADTGFRSKGLDPDDAIVDYDYVASFSFDGHPSKLSMPVTGRGVKPTIDVGPRTDIDFGDLMTHEWADYPVTIVNRQEDLAVNVKISRSSYFVCDPSTAFIPAESSCPVMVRYKPKVMGNHKEQLKIQITSKTGLLLDEVPLYVRGTCSRIGEKPKLVGGVDKLPEDFLKQPR